MEQLMARNGASGSGHTWLPLHRNAGSETLQRQPQPELIRSFVAFRSPGAWGVVDNPALLPAEHAAALKVVHYGGNKAPVVRSRSLSRLAWVAMVLGDRTAVRLAREALDHLADESVPSSEAAFVQYCYLMSLVECGDWENQVGPEGRGLIAAAAAGDIAHWVPRIWAAYLSGHLGDWEAAGEVARDMESQAAQSGWPDYLWYTALALVQASAGSARDAVETLGEVHRLWSHRENGQATLLDADVWFTLAHVAISLRAPTAAQLVGTAMLHTLRRKFPTPITIARLASDGALMRSQPFPGLRGSVLDPNVWQDGRLA